MCVCVIGKINLYLYYSFPCFISQKGTRSRDWTLESKMSSIPVSPKKGGYRGYSWIKRIIFLVSGFVFLFQVHLEPVYLKMVSYLYFYKVYRCLYTLCSNESPQQRKTLQNNRSKTKDCSRGILSLNIYTVLGLYWISVKNCSEKQVIECSS